MFTIDYRSRVPIYDQIVNSVIRLKAVGVLKDGDKLPSVRYLAGQMNINPNTVQKAYAILETSGVIYSVSGQGSFISGDETATAAVLAAAADEFKKAAEDAVRTGLSGSQLHDIIDSLLNGGQKND